MTSCLMMHAWERKDERLCLVNADSKMNPKLENLCTVGYEYVSLTLEQRQWGSQSEPAPTQLHLLEWALLVAISNPENARLGLVQGNAVIVRCSPSAGTSEGVTPGRALADLFIF